MKLLTRKEVCERLRISETTLSRQIDKGLIPNPFTITGSRPFLWIESEIDALIQSCIEASVFGDYFEYQKRVAQDVIAIEISRLKSIE